MLAFIIQVFFFLWTSDQDIYKFGNSFFFSPLCFSVYCNKIVKILKTWALYIFRLLKKKKIPPPSPRRMIRGKCTRGTEQKKVSKYYDMKEDRHGEGVINFLSTSLKSDNFHASTYQNPQYSLCKYFLFK